MDLRSDSSPSGITKCDCCGNWFPDSQVAIDGCAVCMNFRIICTKCAEGESFTDDSGICDGCIAVVAGIEAGEIPQELEAICG